MASGAWAPILGKGRGQACRGTRDGLAKEINTGGEGGAAAEAGSGWSVGGA